MTLRFGYRFIADELPDHGITAGENRVARFCSQERIWSVFSTKRGLNRKASPLCTTISWTASSPHSSRTKYG